MGPGAVAHTHNPNTLGSWVRWITWGQEFETSLANRVKPHPTKNTKLSWAWWHAPVVSATQETEAGESLELGKWRLQWAKIMSLHSSLGDRARLSQKKKKVSCVRTKCYFLNQAPMLRSSASEGITGISFKQGRTYVPKWLRKAAIYSLLLWYPWITYCTWNRNPKLRSRVGSF